MAEGSGRRRKFWRLCCRGLRWLRFGVLGAILLLLLALTWLRVAGLPAFIRLRIVRELAERGVAADFRSLRFDPLRGFVAEDLRVSWGGPTGPRIRMGEADLDVAPPPWGGDRRLIRGLTIRRGTVDVPLVLTNEPARELRIADIRADLRFLEGDVWDVRRLAAEVAGIQLELTARLTNVAGLRRRRAPAEPAPVAQRVRLLRSALDELQRLSAPIPPRLEMSFELDGNHPWSAHGRLYFDAASIRSPHGSLRQLRISLRTQPSDDPTQALRTSGVVEVGELDTPRGGLEGLAARVRFSGPGRPALPTNLTWSASVDQISSRGWQAAHVVVQGSHRAVAMPTDASAAALAGMPLESSISLLADTLEGTSRALRHVQGRGLSVEMEARHHPTLEMPESVGFTLGFHSLAAEFGRAGSTQVRGEVQRREAGISPQTAGPTQVELDWWNVLWPVRGRVDVEVQDVDAPGLRVGHLATRVAWEPPFVRLPRIDADLYGGELHGRAQLDVTTREASATAETTFDLHGLDGLLGERSRENVQRYAWQSPPHFVGTAHAVLPAWTNREPDWNVVMKPTLRLDGRFQVGAGAFKGVPFEHAESSLSFDGQNWRLPDLRTARPEGRQEIAVDYNEDTREYRIDARGMILPPVLKPVLGSSSGEVLDLFQFHEPVTAAVTVWGPWSEGDRQAIEGSVVATNFTFRGQQFDRLATTVHYTNQMLIATPLRLNRGEGDLVADGIGYSFAKGRLWLTNAVNTIDPAVVAEAISPGFPRKIAPYRFDLPPRVRASGTVRPRETSTADMVFDIEGGPFHFWRLSADQIRTRLIWEGSNLVLTNLDAAFYRGRMSGDAYFDLTQPEDGRYRFTAQVRGGNLGDLLSEATPGRTNVSQGTFDLDLNVTSARTSDIHTWNGHGRADLRDGLLWDVPIFGFLSPILNGVVPGLGNNRAERASATFTMTNSVIHTRDLVIACPPARLLYRGTLDFDQRVDAKVEAQVLGEFGALGPFFGLLLRPLTKLFEFHLAGTLAVVHAEPLYIPKFLLFPLQPIKTLKDIFGADHKTNAPPEKGGGESPTPLAPGIGQDGEKR